MKIIYYFLFFPLLTTFFSCNDTKVEVTITNRSHSNIDSVLFPLTKSKWRNIPPGQAETEFVNVSNIESGHESLSLLIYQGAKKMEYSWSQYNEQNKFYVFDNGINTVDIPLQQPDVLTIILINKSANPIDSIVANSLTSNKFKATYHELIFNYSELQADPNFIVYQNQIPINISVDHDWNNWNNSQEFLYLYKNGIVSKKDSLF